jgi:hypothetical protein
VLRFGKLMCVESWTVRCGALWVCHRERGFVINLVVFVVVVSL